MALCTAASPCVAQNHPPMPFFEGSCPYEFGCGFITCIALAHRPLFAGHGDSSEVAFWMNPGDSLAHIGGVMYADELGVVVINDTAGLTSGNKYSVGDTLFILGYTGEGTYDLWYKGRIVNEEVFWDDTPPHEPRPAAQALTPGKSTWWVHMENRTGKRGWLPLINTCPGGGACFGDGIINMIPKDSHGF